MPTYFASQSGDNTTGLSWRTAKQSIQAAISLGLLDNDLIAVDAVHVPLVDKEISANTTYTCTGNVNILASMPGSFVGDDVTVTSTTMAANGTWIGNSTTNRYIRFVKTDGRIFVSGVRFLSNGTAPATSAMANSVGMSLILNNCQLDFTATSGTAVWITTVATSTLQLLNCKVTIIGIAGNVISVAGFVEIAGGMITLGTSNSVFDSGSTGATLFVSGCNINSDAYVLANCASPTLMFMERCRISAPAYLAPQTSNPTLASGVVFVSDSGTELTTPMYFGYFNALGSAVLETGNFYTTGVAQASWKISTTAFCGYNQPFNTPWIDFYIENGVGGLPITPRLEVLSSQTFTDQQLWAVATAKTSNVGSNIPPAATRYTDRALFANPPTNQAAGAGIGQWTLNIPTPVSQKIDSGPLSPLIIPANTKGYIRMQVSVALANVTNLMIDPQIRTT